MDYLKEHLNIGWLRPESALWDAIASEKAAHIPIESPSLDFGCGNGLYSFVAAGGAFDIDYDWFVHARSRGFRAAKDIYDVAAVADPGRHVRRRPRYRFDHAFDHKKNLLSQAAKLDFYGTLKSGDGNERWPYADGEMKTIYCNMLYWLNDPRARFREISRVLRRGGRAILCLQHPRFKTMCESYQWRPRRSEFLRILNRGRAETHDWTVDTAELKSLSKSAGLKLAHHDTYLSAATLKFWDTGLRPLSPALIEMARRLAPADRRAVKKEWLASALPLLREMLVEERRAVNPGGYHLAILEKV